jgi:hypothetical protein
MTVQLLILACIQSAEAQLSATLQFLRQPGWFIVEKQLISAITYTSAQVSIQVPPELNIRSGEVEASAVVGIANQII